MAKKVIWQFRKSQCFPKREFLSFSARPMQRKRRNSFLRNDFFPLFFTSRDIAQWTADWEFPWERSRGGKIYSRTVRGWEGKYVHSELWRQGGGVIGICPRRSSLYCLCVAPKKSRSISPNKKASSSELNGGIDWEAGGVQNLNFRRSIVKFRPLSPPLFSWDGNRELKPRLFVRKRQRKNRMHFLSFSLHLLPISLFSLFLSTFPLAFSSFVFFFL